MELKINQSRPYVLGKASSSSPPLDSDSNLNVVQRRGGLGIADRSRRISGFEKLSGLGVFKE
jgi:hypothetical protein